jgi:elongation factor G
MEFFKPVISVAVEPKTNQDQDKLSFALEKLAEEDPTFQVRYDDDTAQTVISGMGELHLDVLIKRLLEEYNLSVHVGKPQVVYRETIEKEAEVKERFSKVIEDVSHSAEVHLAVIPQERGTGVAFVSAVPEGEVTDELLEVIRESVQESSSAGPLTGYPLTDIKVVLKGIHYSDDEFTTMVIKVAIAQALREACQKGFPILMEPIMELEVIVPEEFMGEVIGDIQARKGAIDLIDTKGKIATIKARPPLTRMFGYSTDLRSMTQGRGTFSMRFFHYDSVSA